MDKKNKPAGSGQFFQVFPVFLLSDNCQEYHQCFGHIKITQIMKHDGSEKKITVLINFSPTRPRSVTRGEN